MCGRAELAAVVRGVTSHEDKGIVLWAPGGRARQAAQVADAMTGAVQEIERAVTEVIVGGESADLRRLGARRKGDFVDLSASSAQKTMSEKQHLACYAQRGRPDSLDVRWKDEAYRRVALGPFSQVMVLEPWTNNQIGRAREE